VKSIIITGSQGRIGSELVRIFTANNWDVIATTRSSLDLTSQPSIQSFVSSLNGKPIDVLLNCAGVYDTASVDDASPGASTFVEIQPVFQVNSIAPKLLADSLLANLKSGQDKLVATISSIMSTRASLDAYSASHWSYGASKAAVNFAMRAYAVANPDIKILLLHPGWVKTKMGGPETPLSPEFSARHLFQLISNHHHYPSGALLDYQGTQLPEP
jgi:NAD(P)-dependent dehydrogenase (short-subunit alcohol dehydrogenase family)